MIEVGRSAVIDHEHPFCSELAQPPVVSVLQIHRSVSEDRVGSRLIDDEKFAEITD